VSEYRARRAARHESMQIRGLSMHVRRWGPESTRSDPPLLFLHGWQDTGDTFQFLVDALERDWPVLAPDWRGFGRSEWPQQGYWFQDYFADLDRLIDAVAEGPVRLIGHSMGGNIASIYAGVRPERVRSVVNLEGVGLPRTDPAQAPARLRQWLEQTRTIPPLKHYASFDELARVIATRFPRFGAARARFVAEAWAQRAADGSVHLLGDARHRWVNPVLYKREDAEACWKQVRAPMLMVLGGLSDLPGKLGADGTPEALTALVQGMRVESISEAGHMMHIEAPDRVAALIEPFLAAH
jgi:pimeloyl-ACP methyl ester carboxylesterase